MLPVVRGLVADGVLVSVDTMRAEVAAAAVESGAVLVNDVSGGLADEKMLPTVAAPGRRLRADALARALRADAAAHRLRRRGRRRGAELRARLDAAAAAGVDPARVAVDPGIGFSKTADQNWDVLAGLERLHDLGHPVLVATSRKRFLGLAARRRVRGAAARPSSARTVRRPRRRSPPRPGRGASGRTTCGPPWTPSAWRTGGPPGPGPGVADRVRRTTARSRRSTPRSTRRSRAPTSTRCSTCGSRTRDALRAPGGAAGAGHQRDQPVLGVDHGEHAVHPVLPDRRRGQRARRASRR